MMATKPLSPKSSVTRHWYWAATMISATDSTIAAYVRRR